MTTTVLSNEPPNRAATIAGHLGKIIDIKTALVDAVGEMKYDDPMYAGPAPEVSNAAAALMDALEKVVEAGSYLESLRDRLSPPVRIERCPDCGGNLAAPSEFEAVAAGSKCHLPMPEGTA